MMYSKAERKKIKKDALLMLKEFKKMLKANNIQLDSVTQSQGFREMIHTNKIVETPDGSFSITFNFTRLNQ